MDPDSEISDAFADPERFNIMVVGESGLGKTTCVQTLLDFFKLENEHDSNDLKWRSTKTVDIVDVGSFWVRKKNTTLPAYVHIYDSPGYGDSINNQDAFDTIKNNLIERHLSYNQLQQDKRNDYNDAELKQKDNRIHCCLYFIAPHRMKNIDIEFIAQLSDIVSIVPVIAKADTMTMHERDTCLSEVKAALKNIELQMKERMKELKLEAGQRFRASFNFDDQDEIYDSAAGLKDHRCISADEPCEDDSTDATAESMPEVGLGVFKKRLYDHGAEDSEPDDSPDDEGIEDPSVQLPGEDTKEGGEANIIASNATEYVKEQEVIYENPQIEVRMMFNSHGEISTRIKRYRNIFSIIADRSLYRDYPWGKCEVENPQHSDLPVLKRLLFSHKTVRGMIDETRKRSRVLLMKKDPQPREEIKHTNPVGRVQNILICILLCILAWTYIPEKWATQSSLMFSSINVSNVVENIIPLVPKKDYEMYVEKAESKYNTVTQQCKLFQEHHEASFKEQERRYEELKTEADRRCKANIKKQEGKYEELKFAADKECKAKIEKHVASKSSTWWVYVAAFVALMVALIFVMAAITYRSKVKLAAEKES